MRRRSLSGKRLFYEDGSDYGVAVGGNVESVLTKITVESPQISESAQLLRQLIHRHFVAASVHENDIVQIIALSGESNYTVIIYFLVVEYKIGPASLHVRNGMSHLAQALYIRKKILILMSPGETTAVEGVFIAL